MDRGGARPPDWRLTVRYCTVLCVLLPILVQAETLVHELRFRPADVAHRKHQGFDVVGLPRGVLLPDPGKPSLPVVTLTLVLPSNAEVTDVHVEALRSEVLPGTYRILPTQPFRPLSLDSVFEFVPPDPGVYSLNESWSHALPGHTVGNASGFRLVSVGISPFQYRPAPGILQLDTRMRIRVEYRTVGLPRTLRVRQQAWTMQSLGPLVSNPEDLARFAPPVTSVDQDEVDFLIITHDKLAPELAGYVEYRSRRGLRTEIRTVQWVDHSFPGRDLPERIRNCVIDYNENRGLSFLLLAGDDQQVPARRITVDLGPGEVYRIPTDLYYGDLDSTWDSDGDSLFGEPYDDYLDLYADVLVGRASVDNPAQCSTFMLKAKTYEQDPGLDYIKRALFPSGWLWQEVNYHGRVVNESIAGLTPGWEDVLLVDPASHFEAAESLDHGFAIFTPQGHGNERGICCQTGASIYNGRLAGRQVNWRRLAIMSSIACLSGNFTYEDCLAEQAHNCPTGGSIASILNSHYGWGTPPWFGPSEEFCTRFFDFMLCRDCPSLGAIHDRSREEYVWEARWDWCYRWCYTEFNLLGDPTLDIWTDTMIQPDVSCPDSVRTGAQTINVTVTDSTGPVIGAQVCAWKQDEVLETDSTDGSGLARLEVHPIAPGTLYVSATGHNLLPAAAAVPVTLGSLEPHVVFVDCRVEDQGQPHPNGVLDPGETALLTLVVRNRGTAPASNTMVTVRALTSGLSILDSTARYGTIPAGDTVSTQELAVYAVPDILPGSTAELLGSVRCDEAQWEFRFQVQIGYPGRITAEIDTGCCALTISARGALGFDVEGVRSGRGFRFPETDTSSLSTASFCVGTGAEYVADRYYDTTRAGADQDWSLEDSIYSIAPPWNAHQALGCAFTDAGHAQPKGLKVELDALGRGAPGEDNFVILVYKVINTGSAALTGLHAAVFADFDIVATDPFHDFAFTDTVLRTAFMRNALALTRYCGVELLSSDLPCLLGCIDHKLYLLPDSGLTEDMKWRAMTGSLGTATSDRSFDWSVLVSGGPFELAPDSGYRDVGFAFVAAADSVSYLEACRSAQEWYHNNVGIDIADLRAASADRRLKVAPNPCVDFLSVWVPAWTQGGTALELYDRAGRRVSEFPCRQANHDGRLEYDLRGLPAGVYFLHWNQKGGRGTEKFVIQR
jgi:uncharacterized repeat protein (TIGR01451 family)